MRPSAIALCLALPFAVACGSGMQSADAGPVDMTPPDDLTVVPDLMPPPRDAKAHPQLPQVTFYGGKVLHHVDVVTVGWAAENNDPLMQQREAFAEWLVQSDYYNVLNEYGVFSGTARGFYKIMDAPPTTLDDSAVGPLLRAKLADGTLPAPTSETLYVFYLPDGVVSTLQGEVGCNFYGGYHESAKTNLASPAPTRVTYAIIPKCIDGPGQFDSDTSVVSHEVAEAATDPFSDGWIDGSVQLGEIGDLCTPLDTTVDATAPDGGVPLSYNVNRLYSQKAAADGTSDPCLPLPDPAYVYFNAGIDPFDGPIVSLDANGNGTATFQIEPYAFGNVGRIDWQIDPYPITGLTYSPHHGSGYAGSTSTVIVRVIGGTAGTYPLSLSTSAKSWNNVWFTTITLQ